MNLLKEAKIEDVYGKISSGQKLQLNINYYQRPYKWPAKKIADLFEDYSENKKKALLSGKISEKEYFLGAVVLVDQSNSTDNCNDVCRYQVVDGQQRLTTLFLFNYLKFLMLISKANILVEKNSRGLEKCLDRLVECYDGFVGSVNTDKIKNANDNLLKACDYAVNNRENVDLNKINEWREAVGWISNPDFSDQNYRDVCSSKRESFFNNDKLRLFYDNTDYNDLLKKGISNIVIKASTMEKPSIIEYEEVDQDSEEIVEWPFVARAYNIFNKIKMLYANENPAVSDPVSILDGYVELIDEMLKNIKLCMIISNSEDDAYKLFETLNDRSESVSDLELIKDYFYKTYTVTSREDKNTIYSKISDLDRMWKDEIFNIEDYKERISYCATVLLTGSKDIKQNDIKRKRVQKYLEKYNDTNGYTSELIQRDFDYINYIRKVFEKIMKKTKSANKSLSLYIENEASHNEASIVKRALGLAIHLKLQAVIAGLVNDIVSTYVQNGVVYTFDEFLDIVCSEHDCKKHFIGLWKDCNVLWKAMMMSREYENPKKFADILIENCSIDHFNDDRDVNSAMIAFGGHIIEESDLRNEFQTWLGEWTFFKDNNGKIKVKNLFLHLYNRYDFDEKTNSLKYRKVNRGSYTLDSIEQDLDHMDAHKPDVTRKTAYFSYDNLGNRVMYTNSLGNMMPLPVRSNRAKQNTPMVESIAAYAPAGMTGWIFTEAQKLFDDNKIIQDGHEVPTEEFFNERKKRLIKYFIKIVDNQKENPDETIAL